MITLRFIYIQFWTGTGFAPSPFLVSTSSLLILTNAFQNGSVFASSTAYCSAPGVNEKSEYGIVPRLAKMTQYSRKADRIEIGWHRQIGSDGIR